jgi:hypothetical protein
VFYTNQIKENKKGLQREHKWNILQLSNKMLEGGMFYFARDCAAFASLVSFCATLAVWGDVILSAG